MECPVCSTQDVIEIHHRLPDGSEVSFWYTGGPFSTVSTEEYLAMLEPYAGLELPDPIVEPDLP